MRVLVTFAVEAEFAPWRKLHTFTREPAGDLNLWKTSFGGTDLFVLLTGIGRTAGAEVMGVMMIFAGLEEFFDVCISSGLAGALDSRHCVGEILAAQYLRSHAEPQKERLASDSTLLELAVANGAKSVPVFYTAERVLTTAKEKEELASSADAVDMESFEVINEARVWGPRTIAIRAVSDGSEMDLPIDFNRTINAANRVSIPRVLTELAKRPSALPGLIEFGKQSREAAELLARFLDTYILRLAQLGIRRQSTKVTA
jgi:nucleoside phosphorylase